MNKRQRNKRKLDLQSIIELDEIVTKEGNEVSLETCIEEPNKFSAIISAYEQQGESISCSLDYRQSYRVYISPSLSDEEWDKEFLRIFGQRTFSRLMKREPFVVGL